MKLAETAQKNKVGLYWDAVLNHKFAADHREKCMAAEVNPDNRNEFVSDKYEIEAWVGFDFPGRGDKYSSMKYHWYHFSGVDYNAANGKKAIYKIMGDLGSEWAAVPDVDGEKGN
jgi:alpha-amylase